MTAVLKMSPEYVMYLFIAEDSHGQRRNRHNVFRCEIFSGQRSKDFASFYEIVAAVILEQAILCRFLTGFHSN